MELSQEFIKELRLAQKNEITEYHIYGKLGRAVKNAANSRVFSRIAEDELKHYKFWLEYTKTEIKPNRWKIFKFFWICRIFGLTFGLKLMERGEERAQINYAGLADAIPGAQAVIDDEEAHERELIDLIEEEKLNYIGSIVLGLNDALIELTGALAGFTFALQNTHLIALVGMITGIAAAFSMAASEYLSTKSEGSAERAVKSSIYTGFAYIVTVILLVLPYILIRNYFLCLVLTLVIALLIIFLFNFYLAVARDYAFKKRFAEMAFLSLGVAALSFGIGFLIRQAIGVEV